MSVFKISEAQISIIFKFIISYSNTVNTKIMCSGVNAISQRFLRVIACLTLIPTMQLIQKRSHPKILAPLLIPGQSWLQHDSKTTNGIEVILGANGYWRKSTILLCQIGMIYEEDVKFISVSLSPVDI